MNDLDFEVRTMKELPMGKLSQIFVIRLNDENFAEKIKDEYDEQIFENYDRL